MKYKTLRYRINKDEGVRNESFLINTSKIHAIDFYHDGSKAYNAGKISISIDQKMVIDNAMIFNNRSGFNINKMNNVCDSKSNLKEITISHMVKYLHTAQYINIFIIVQHD